MRVRHLIALKKRQTADTAVWSVKDLPPRHCPIYTKSRPSRAGWQWRSLSAAVDGHEFTMVAICNPNRGNWKSMLLVKVGEDHSVVARFEHHESHPGVHVHAHCERGGIEIGPIGINGLVRIPPASMTHRRQNAWTLSTFWTAAKSFYRIDDQPGPLFTYAP